MHEGQKPSHTHAPFDDHGQFNCLRATEVGIRLSIVATLSKRDLDYIWRQGDRGRAKDAADITPDQRERQCRFDEEIISCESRLGPFGIKREHHADAMTLLPPLPRDALSDIRWRARETGSAPWLRCAGLEAVCAQQDLLDACANRDLGTVITVLNAHGLRQGQIAKLTGILQGRLGECAQRKRMPQASTTFEAGIREGDEHAASGVLG
jgi:hypothetical protein